jgi:hypothetical protein
MVLAAFTALTLTFDVWEATRISPHDLPLIPTPSQPRQRNQEKEQNKPTHSDKSKTETGLPKLLLQSKVRTNATGDRFTIIDWPSRNTPHELYLHSLIL